MSHQEQISRALAYYPRLRAVQEFVERHLGEPMELEDAARVASLEPKYFAKFFKAKTGISFSIWLRDQRVARALALLETTEMPIATVARQVGLSERTFLRVFRERTGTTPRDYLKRVRPD